MDNDLRGVHQWKEGFPWSHVIGFVISIVLTLIALWLVQSRAHSPRWLLTVTLALAILQILVQLFFFMHITESHGPRWHAQMITIGFLFVLAIVAGSIWIMGFGGTGAY
jgi:cytochrome o ubiquinol oxidase subunit IV